VKSRTPLAGAAGLGACLAVLCTVLAPAGPAHAAAPDGNVEWAGVSHVGWLDRRPLCPMGRESFQVRFQAYRDDLTAARVQVDEGGTITWIDASPTETRGPYDIWTAQVPAATSDQLAYWLELTDGTDTDYYSVGGMSGTPPTDGGFAVDFATLEHAPVGSTPATGGTVFKVWAPTRTSVYVRGDFNGWGLTNALTKVGEHFIGLVPGTADRQMYKYYFNNSVWNTDARGRALNPSNNLNAYLEDPFRYVWTSDGYGTPPLEEMVIYQLHVGTFAGRNDPLGGTPFPSRYVDVAARAGHLAELGVNAVMLNPITEFAGDLSAGYNPITQWAPEWKYGTPDQLKNLVDTLHQHGIAVLLDIVWNHFSYSDNFLWYYDGSQIYFDTPAVETPWGSQADFDREAVQDYFADSALHWLEEYRIDGFRMDATGYMDIPPQDASGWALMQRLNDEMDNRFADRVAIAEQLPDDSWVTRPTAYGGAGFDSQYHDAFTDQLRQELIDSLSGSAEMGRILSIINGSGTYLNGKYVTNYLELHDEAWPSSGGQRMVKTLDPTYPHDDAGAQARIKLAQGLVLLSPGVPAFLQGSEWLEDTDFGSDSANRIDWSKKVTYSNIFAWFQDVIALRTGLPAFRADSPHQVSHVNDSYDILGFTRSDGQGGNYYVLVNFRTTDRPAYRVGVPVAGTWTEIVNSESTVYGGTGLTNPGTLTAETIPQDGFAQSLLLDVPGLSLLVLASQTPVAVGEPARPGEEPAARLRFANPLRRGGAISFSLDAAGAVRLDVIDAGGRRVRTLVDGPLPAGSHQAAWDGTARDGSPAAGGVYFLRLRTGASTWTSKVTLLR